MEFLMLGPMATQLEGGTPLHLRLLRLHARIAPYFPFSRPKRAEAAVSLEPSLSQT
jgi:hypothetical protein